MKKAVRLLFLLVLDILIAFGSMALAVLIMNDFGIVSTWNPPLWKVVGSFPILALSGAISFFACGNDRVLWQFASVRDMLRLGVSAAVSFTLYGVASYFAHYGLSLGLYVGAGLIAFLLMLGSRVVLRWFLAHRSLRQKRGEGLTTRFSGNVMVVGAGNAGSLLIHDITHNYATHRCRVVCLIDDDPHKYGQYVQGVRVVGDRRHIAEAVKKYAVDRIVCAIPSMSASEQGELYNLCANTGLPVKTLPDMNEILDGNVGVAQMRDVSIDDLLRRDPIVVDLGRIGEELAGKTVLVTGGGGSIGSELCRQVAGFKPKKLILFDIYENNAYDIQNELLKTHPELDVLALIGSVRDVARLEAVFETYRPDYVYHAAAHKHVPLMEDSPNEAIKNNVFGTFNTARAADKFGVKRFVLISTDKAVNPTNIMGASKRLCELIVQTFSRHSKTEFAAVRFGNVLGSNGSVVPLFKRQIAEGGPVTVTHKDIIRYFMTIPEAVSLVLMAGCFARGGEIFVLDMGRPVKILTLAENLIRLSGYEPYKEIAIEFTGLRPGEKLFEELLMDEEGLQKTENDLIRVGRPIDFDEDKLLAGLGELRGKMADDRVDIRALVRELVPTYHDPETAAEKTYMKQTEELHTEE